MNRIGLIISTLLLNVSISSSAYAETYVFPAKGQDAEQMEKDKFSCYGWAKKQSSFDPMNPPTATAPTPSSNPSALRGATRGAIGGAIIGAIAGDAGEGAAIGAAAGGIGRGVINRNERSEQEHVAKQKETQIAQMKNNYDRAYMTCLEGKGYTAK